MLKKIQERFSTRVFAKKEVSEEDLKQVLEAARLAPSWVNTQPWHFIAVKNPRTKSLLCQLSNSQPHVEAAPVVIVCCGDESAWEHENYKNTMLERGMTEERIDLLLNNAVFNPSLISRDSVKMRTLEQVAIAIAYMTLQAKSLGLGTCVIGAIGNNFTYAVPEVYELAKRTLELPENVSIMTLMALGYPDESVEPPKKLRKPFDKVVSFEHFGG